MKQDIDYIYTKQVFDRLEQVEIEGVPLPAYFAVDGCDYWQFYRQRVFEDIKTFSCTKTFVAQKRRSALMALKDAAIGAGMIALGLLAYIALVLRRKRVLIYGIDRVNSQHGSDFRMSALYDFLEQYGIPYSELLHTVLGKPVLKNALIRKRPALYLEACEQLYALCIQLRIMNPYRTIDMRKIDLGGFDVSERDFIQMLITRYVYQIGVSRFKVAVLASVFRHSPLTVLYAIDDARYYHEIILAARLGGLKSYALQHGHFTKYHVGWLRNSAQVGATVHPDELLVWSEYWKNELLRLGSATPERAIRVSGGNASSRTPGDEDMTSKECITVLIPYETSCPKSEVAIHILNMLRSKRVRVIFKLRPDMEENVQLSEYGLDQINDPHFLAIKDVTKNLQEVDIVAGVYSTFLYDMIAIGKRVAILETTSDYGEGMRINGLADILSKNADVYASLESIRSIPHESIERRRKKLIEIETTLPETLAAIAIEHKLIKK